MLEIPWQTFYRKCFVDGTALQRSFNNSYNLTYFHSITWQLHSRKDCASIVQKKAARVSEIYVLISVDLCQNYCRRSMDKIPLIFVSVPSWVHIYDIIVPNQPLNICTLNSFLAIKQFTRDYTVQMTILTILLHETRSHTKHISFTKISIRIINAR